MLETTNEKKKRKEIEHERIRELSSDKSYWITTNFDTFMDRLRQDEENQKKKNQMQEETHRRRRDKEVFFLLNQFLK